jgi:hypothetical protein
VTNPVAPNPDAKSTTSSPIGTAATDEVLKVIVLSQS